MTRTNRIDIKLMQPFDFLKFMDPVDPQYFELSCWRWLPLFSGDKVFPLIKPGNIYEGFAVGDLGLDYDGSEMGIITEGPQMGCTVMIMPPRNPNGQFRAPRFN